MMLKKILIADDSRFSRKAIIHECSSFLPDLDYTEASNGIEALDQVRSKKFDLIFLDLNMPDMNGFEFLKEIKKENIEVNVVVISANFQAEAVDRVKEDGAVDFIKKPPRASTIKDVLERNNLI